MFKRKTLFIVGAGASAEAGLPVGEILAAQISALLRFDPSGDPSHPGMQLLSQLYNRFPLPDDGYAKAAAHISRGVVLTKSIDDFMDRHSGDVLIQRVGKAAIVKCILDSENRSFLSKYTFDSPDMFLALRDTWYIKFFRMLGSDIKIETVSEIFENLSFIVFNYDRCLEYFLITALDLVYDIGRNDARRIVDQMTIIHPYGVVAPLHGRNSAPFGVSSANYAVFSANIKIYTEQHAAGDVLGEIAKAMLRAEQIGFLGFGYHEQNLELLTPENPLPSKPVFGTAKDWSDNDRDEIRQRIERMFQPPPPKINPKSAVVIDTKVTCAGLFDSYGQSLTGR
jgi:hypothetical protein